MAHFLLEQSTADSSPLPRKQLNSSERLEIGLLI